MSDSTLESFVEHETLHDATIYRLQYVSEAVRNLLRLDPTVAERFPHIDWIRVRDFGNVSRHEYGDLELSIVWYTAVGERLNDVREVAEAELRRRTGTS